MLFFKAMEEGLEIISEIFRAALLIVGRELQALEKQNDLEPPFTEIRCYNLWIPHLGSSRLRNGFETTGDHSRSRVDKMTRCWKRAHRCHTILHFHIQTKQEHMWEPRAYTQSHS
jgi:hypothetical protein